MEFLRQLVRGIAQAWQSLTTSARVQVILAAVATAVVITGVVLYGGSPQYIDLYRGLSREDSSAIISFLNDRGIKYKVEDDGATILVPVGNQQQARLDLAAKELPKSHGGSAGFELLDRQNIMTNQWLQDVNYRRAIEGELTRFLLDFDFIRKAVVHISEAKDELFTNEQKPSKAAVSIDVTRTPTPAERKALLSIIASFGGANLDQRHITLTTFDGTPLYLPPTDEFAAIANSQLETIHAFESEREKKAQDALAQMGITAVVRVSAEMDFSSTNEKTEQTFEGTPLSESSTTTTTTTSESLPEGPVGATQNVPEGSVKPGGTKTEENIEDTITNYQPSTKTIEKTTPAGTVKKYVVAAAIEGTYGKADASGVAAYTPPTEEVKATCKNIILASVGAGVRPEDITVSDMSFRNPSITKRKS
ncbi:MAG: flagellar M-ring protein FliF [Candidatus Hydrogenedentes bacterium]|nr:flagellar M-ring protein FliF [Candidatus Hydrogenedentota bacterium]